MRKRPILWTTMPGMTFEPLCLPNPGSPDTNTGPRSGFRVRRVPLRSGMTENSSRHGRRKARSAVLAPELVTHIPTTSLPGLTRQSTLTFSGGSVGKALDHCKASWMRGSSPRMTWKMTCPDASLVTHGRAPSSRWPGPRRAKARRPLDEYAPFFSMKFVNHCAFLTLRPQTQIPGLDLDSGFAASRCARNDQREFFSSWPAKGAKRRPRA